MFDRVEIDQNQMADTFTSQQFGDQRSSAGHTNHACGLTRKGIGHLLSKGHDMACTGRSEVCNISPNAPDLVNLLMPANFVIHAGFHRSIWRHDCGPMVGTICFDCCE